MKKRKEMDKRQLAALERKRQAIWIKYEMMERQRRRAGVEPANKPMYLVEFVNLVANKRHSFLIHIQEPQFLLQHPLVQQLQQKYPYREGWYMEYSLYEPEKSRNVSSLEKRLPLFAYIAPEFANT